MPVTDIDDVFRTEWPRLVATLMRDFGDLELAEDCAQEAFLAASRLWCAPGEAPDNPGAWLTTTARRKALDRVRRSASYQHKLHELDVRAKTGPQPSQNNSLLDDELALVLGCCHPSLNLEAQVALTLRLVAGLTTEQIAQAFLVEESTMSKRLTRAKAKIRDAGVPFRTVDREILRTRLTAVCRVIYLIFNEGHASTSEKELVRGDLCDEAIWLASLLAQLVPDQAEVHGLHSLILLSDARRATRLDSEGIPIRLEDQDRGQWDTAKTHAGLLALARAKDLGHLGSYGLQALLSSLHGTAPRFEDTDWERMVRIYDLLMAFDSSPVVQLNRAIAVSFAEGPENGLEAIEPLRAALDGYVYLHVATAELLRRLDRNAEARASYRNALGCGPVAPQQTFIERRLASL